MSLHPATRLALFVALAVLVSRLPIFLPAALLGLAVVGPRRRNLARLLWRSRWLLILLFVGYGWTLPGAPLADGYGFWMPSVEGLQLGAVQSLRLAGMLAALDFLLLALPAERLLAGMWVGLRTLERLLPVRLRPDPERIALRLWLTLRELQGARGKVEGILDALRSIEGLGPVACERVELPVEALRWLDWLVLLGLLTSLIGVSIWHA